MGTYRLGGLGTRVTRPSEDGRKLRRAGAVVRGAGRRVRVGVFNQSAGRCGGCGDCAPGTGDGSGALAIVALARNAGKAEEHTTRNRRHRDRWQVLPLNNGRELIRR